MNYLCASQGTSTFVVYGLLIVALIAMLIMPYFTQKKKNQEYMKMLENIHVGDLVKTAGGIIGKVNKITDKGDIKTVVLETGSKSEKSYMELDMSMIYCVLKSTKAPAVEGDKKEDTETKVAEEEKTAIEEKSDEKQELKTEEKSEEKTVEKAEEKSESKKPAKKVAAKKTTKKESK